jgi:PKD repeat protein
VSYRLLSIACLGRTLEAIRLVSRRCFNLIRPCRRSHRLPPKPTNNEKENLVLCSNIICCNHFPNCSKKGSSSNPAPVANFTYSGAGVAPATVNFTNNSNNAFSYLWDFGDNATSTSSSPTHTYTQGGVYTVKLTATGAGGSNSTTKTVNISAPTSVKIIGLKLKAMSFVDPSCSCGWDATSGPDVFFKLITPANNVAVTGTTFTDITTASLPLLWNFTTPYQISVLTDVYKIEIWEFDTPDPNDLISSFTFTPSLATGYPTTVSGTSGSTQIELTLQWQ